MNPLLSKPLDQIRWHHVSDFDLEALCTHHDPEISAAAVEEKSIRQRASGRGEEKADNDNETATLFTNR